jgi:PAS domain S-box-containing protein
MLTELRMPPFDRTPAFSAIDVWRRYQWQVMLGIAVTGSLLALGVSLLLVNRRLRIEKERVQQQSANLEASEQKLTSILDGVDACIYLKDTQGRYLFANRAVRQLWQSEMDDIIGFGDEKFFDAATAANIRINDRRVLENGETLKAEEINTVDGTQKSVTYQTTKMPLRRPDGSIYALCGISTDISEIRHTQEALQASLKEKVALLNEVHHRVKNNLQVITSLLRLEARRSNQPDTKTVLTEMQGRIRSMALLHESLYRSGIFASVELGTYLRQLATQAFRAQSSINGSIQLQLDLNPVQVSMDQATPCGLLVNELISNCLKHGFPDNRQGDVRIALQTLAGTTGGATRVRLCVSDTGIGLSADFESRRGNSLGLQLVSDLTQQLGGCLEIGPGPGAAFTVTFTVAEPA